MGKSDRGAQVHGCLEGTWGGDGERREWERCRWTGCEWEVRENLEHEAEENSQIMRIDASNAEQAIYHRAASSIEGMMRSPATNQADERAA